jgi:tetratricopeptide (TPR) repeat protein
VSRLLAPLAVFAAVLAAMVALNNSATAPPALSAGGVSAGGDPGADGRAASRGAPGGDLGRASGDPLADAQAAVRAAPASASAYASLGEAYLDRARDTGDPGFYSRADRALDAALRRDPRSLAALVGAGTLAGLRHDFSEQLRLGREARRVAPELARPLTVIADAQIELGRYSAARLTIQRLVDLKPSLPAYARASYYRELHGDLSGAVEAMRFAVSAGGSPEGSAYVETLLGDLELTRGRIAAARAEYRMALRDLPNFPQALTGLARIDAASGRLHRAAARLRRSTNELPLTTALTLLAEVETAAAHRDAARAAGRAARRAVRGGQAVRHRATREFRAARADLAAARVQHGLLGKSGTLPDAEAVLFEANHGSARRAVSLGRRVWRAPSIRSADALGWALTRAGHPREGLVWVRRALRTGSQDPMFRLHAGVAARRAGRVREAEPYLTTAWRGRAALSPASTRLLEEARR